MSPPRTRRRTSAETVPAPTPTLEEAADELRAHTARQAAPAPTDLVLDRTRCGYCRRDALLPAAQAHPPCAYAACSCYCRARSAVAAPDGKVHPPAPAPNLLAFLDGAP